MLILYIIFYVVNLCHVDIVNLFQAESNAHITKLEDEIKTLTRNGENEKVKWARKLEEMADELKQVKQDLFDKKQVGN